MTTKLMSVHTKFIPLSQTNRITLQLTMVKDIMQNSACPSSGDSATAAAAPAQAPAAAVAQSPPSSDQTEQTAQLKKSLEVN